MEQHRRVSSLILFCLIALLIASSCVSAQSRKGTITGQITDVSGGVLKGAKISVDPSGATAATDVSGQFILNGLDPGTYTITVTYVGFSPITKTIEVTAGQNIEADVQLQLAAQSLQVLVTAPRASAEAAAVNEERGADNIFSLCRLT